MSAAPFRLTQRVAAMVPSATLAISAQAAALKAQGVDVISLSVGEPDCDTPDFIKDAAKAAMDAGQTRYTAVGGTPTLKDAIAKKLLRDNQLTYKSNQIVVSCGAKQALFNLLLACVEPGDEVVIPAPYWVSYPEMVRFAGGTPVILTTQEADRFKLRPETLRQAITPRTRLLVINSPANPTGVAYTRADWEALGDVLRHHPHVGVVSDDIYEGIMWAKEPFSNLAMVCPDLKDRMVLVNGVSKMYAMTGWRIGYAAGPVAIIQAMNTIQSQSTSNPNSVAQAAAAAALTGPQESIQTMAQVFHQRHDRMVAALNTMPGVRCVGADGTFYAFANITQAMTRVGARDDVAFASYLLDKARVAVVPGSAFGAPGYIRLSYASSDALLEEGLQRMRACLA